MSDATFALGAVTILCGVAGAFDDGGDGVLLVGAGVAAMSLGVVGHRSFQRTHRPAPGRVLSGLALSWLVLVAFGAGIYLTTGTIGRLDDAFVEAAAGFSTTSVTTLDPSGLSLPMQLWRAATQWVGGLIGIIVAVVAVPLALRGRVLADNRGDRTSERLAPTAMMAQHRVVVVYCALTVALGLAYALVGLGARDSVVHAMTTISTGGFSSHPDSFVGIGAAARVVATVGMVVGGSSFFVLWWLVRGRVQPVWRSTELRVYLGLLGAGSVLVALVGDGMGVGDAIFTATAALSTTGYAVGDWTVLNDGVPMVLLLMIGTGSMSGSAGGGLRIVRAWTLVGFASRELRRQLDPNSIVVVKQGGQAIDERTLERTTGYQIAHLGLCGLAGFLLAAAGVDLVGAIYTGISVLSTHGPGIGTGAFGSLESFSPVARLFLTPFMLAGRLTILPLLLAVSFTFKIEGDLLRAGRRLVKRAKRR